MVDILRDINMAGCLVIGIMSIYTNYTKTLCVFGWLNVSLAILYFSLRLI